MTAPKLTPAEREACETVERLLREHDLTVRITKMAVPAWGYGLHEKRFGDITGAIEWARADRNKP